jgi:hypothetical protein
MSAENVCPLCGECFASSLEWFNHKATDCLNPFNPIPVESPYSLDDQIGAVKRELRLRNKLYPKWVSAGRMKPGEADREIRLMQAVLASLIQFKGAEQLELKL